MAEQGKPGGTPSGAQGGASDDLPEWLAKIPGVDLDKVRADQGLVNTIKGYGLREADYTKKTQEIAPLRKLAERLGNGADLEKELERLSARDQWLATNWPTIEGQLSRLQQLEQQGPPKQQQNGADQNTNTGRRHRISTDDLFDQERLDAALNQYETGIVSTVGQQWRDWYEKEELPRLDTRANQLAETVLSAITAIWPKEMTDKGVTLQRLLKERALTGGREPLSRLAESLLSGTASTEKDAELRGYERAKKELEEQYKGRETPAPPGFGTPTWKRPEQPLKKNDRSGLFDSVMADVEKKHGALPR